MFTVKILNSISEDVIKQVTEIDHKTFEREDWITEEDAGMIYSIKNDSLIILYENRKPIGFITVFGIRQDMVNTAIESNTALYQLLTPEILSDKRIDAVYGYCFSILPQYRGQGLIYALYKGLKVWLTLKADMNTPIYAEAVSDEGFTCLSRLGFNTIHHYEDNGKLQKTICRDVVKRIEKLLENNNWVKDISIEI